VATSGDFSRPTSASIERCDICGRIPMRLRPDTFSSAISDRASSLVVTALFYLSLLEESERHPGYPPEIHTVLFGTPTALDCRFVTCVVCFCLVSLTSPESYHQGVHTDAFVTVERRLFWFLCPSSVPPSLPFHSCLGLRLCSLREQCVVEQLFVSIAVSLFFFD